MKTPLSLPKFIFLFFGLSLVSLSTYISFLFQPGFEQSRFHLTLIVESAEQRFGDEEEWYFSSLHKHEPIGWITIGSPPTSQRHLELPHRTLPVESLGHTAERRLLIGHWVMVAMTIIAIPISAYKLVKTKHRLGGWKEANLQFRSIVQHQ
ncbi:hypothetical protein [Photobacterium rosenbergii]|uniref:hypothetical protein n=1 Tax=Photobacterium rosenbergii TaxID=294936 RepID=UPI001C991673|nr:hypothetical protein [Photobacterium rosenbergii]MBY5946384.1 hypothetical protein [Photobacterium rosenbergii]